MPMKRSFKIIRSAWTVFAHLAGMGVVALLMAFALVQYVSGSNAVIVVTDFHLITPLVEPRGKLRYVYDLERRESCPGEAVITYTSTDVDGAPAVVTLRRPMVLTDVRSYNDLRIENDIPASVTPGMWHVSVYAASHCANRERIDPVHDFDIEVRP